LLDGVPDTFKAHWEQPGVGHYGVFNGSRFRAEIAPRIADFVLSNDFRRAGRKVTSIGAKQAARLDPH
jgi:poly(3-hydroxybutyrate) depolymerase